jgi:hypothetical protein
MAGGCATGKRSDTTNDNTETPGQLRFDGMYYRAGVVTPNRNYDQNYTYLRFYPDGTMIAVGTASKPDDATKWLNKKRYASFVTKYKLKGNDIGFGMDSGGGLVAYDGQVMEDKLNMTVYSGGKDYTFEFFFMQMDFEKE